MWVIEHDEIETLGEAQVRLVREGLERALVPGDFDTGELRIDPRRVDDRVIAARMVPGHALEPHIAPFPPTGSSIVIRTGFAEAVATFKSEIRIVTSDRSFTEGQIDEG